MLKKEWDKSLCMQRTLWKDKKGNESNTCGWDKGRKGTSFPLSTLLQLDFFIKKINVLSIQKILRQSKN